MKKFFATALMAVFYVCAVSAQKPTSGLTFDVSKGVAGSVTMPDGCNVHYTAYTNLYYVTNIEDSAYQFLNVFVPEGATQQSPIFLRNYVGGYMAAEPRGIDPADASGRALSEGYVVVIPGVRGRNSSITDRRGHTIYTGRAPRGLLDLKAAVRYLRHFDRDMPGNAERIFSDGTSAGGAMSALLGATGNHPDYEPMLKAMGAADERDDIFAAVCYCPIIDLNHADMAYEWMYAPTNNSSRKLTDQQKAVSEQLAGLYPNYLTSLNLLLPDGRVADTNNLRDYIKTLLLMSAQKAKDMGAEIPDSLGFVFSRSAMDMPPVNGGINRRNGGLRPPLGNQMPPRRMRKPEKGEYVVDFNLDHYLDYVVSTIALKTPPAFDSQGVAGGKASGENEEFGNERGSSINFTDFSLQQATGNNNAHVDAATTQMVRMMNPMYYIGTKGATIAPHWYIRHGARDRDTAFPVPVCLALKLQNNGYDVDLFLPWNRPHMGDYSLNELFQWCDQKTK